MKLDEWRKNAELIRKRGRSCASEYARKELGPDRPSQICSILIPAEWFQFAFEHGYDAERCLTPQERYARLSPTEREEKRKALSTAYLKPEKNGRPLGIGSRQAATLAHYFYDAWRSENEKQAIADYGHRSEMKDIAAQAIVEDFFAWMLPFPKVAWRLEPATDADSFFHIVRNLMDKPKKRRDLGEDFFDRDVEIQASYDKGLISKLPPKPPRK